LITLAKTLYPAKSNIFFAIKHRRLRIEMGVETRSTTPTNQIFRTEDNAGALAELFEAAARWIRDHQDISVIDLSLHMQETGPDKNDLELNVYFEHLF
jgi:hypothetical protein